MKQAFAHLYRDWNHGKEDRMSGLYVLGLVLALGLLIYLVIALLRPELFQ